MCAMFIVKKKVDFLKDDEIQWVGNQKMPKLDARCRCKFADYGNR